MFIHTNRENGMQLRMDHNGESQLHVYCVPPDTDTSSPNEVE